MSFDDQLSLMPVVGYKPPNPEEKLFVLKDLLNLKKEFGTDGRYQSKEEDFYNSMWSIVILKEGENIKGFLHRRTPEGQPQTSMEVSFTIDFKTKEYERGLKMVRGTFKGNQETEMYGKVLCKWDALELSAEEEADAIYPEDISDEVLKRMKLRHQIGKPQGEVKNPHEVVIRVKVLKTKLLGDDGGREKQWMPATRGAGTTLKLRGEIMIISKQTPAFRFPWFRTLETDQKKKHILQLNIDPYDFKDFLVAAKNSKITETNVEGVLLVARMIDAKELVRKCEIFIKSPRAELSLEKRFRLALQNGLEALQEECVLKFEKMEDMYTAIPSYLQSSNISKLQTHWENQWLDMYRAKMNGEVKMEPSDDYVQEQASTSMKKRREIKKEPKDEAWSAEWYEAAVKQEMLDDEERQQKKASILKKRKAKLQKESSSAKKMRVTFKTEEPDEEYNQDQGQSTSGTPMEIKNEPPNEDEVKQEPEDEYEVKEELEDSYWNDENEAEKDL